ncbi:MAG TPA: DegT/DnrJ/EryC1/StrS family aminotransferase [Saprospiraceae bacterium]|nr:DegT/DnrJ/EryC1/StrS family aminotransferase [Saprospiraceae bacterium]HQW55852.1 DegT/DnrJ/EryC1/StrS family aminotransferase [Saprospiraceae bacterium]
MANRIRKDMPGYEWFGEAERKEINDVLDTGILMRYGFEAQRKDIWKARDLESALGKKLGCDYVQLVSSGTAAITTALAAMGIGYGDEVIMPVFTFVASFEAVLSVGAIPVLTEIDESMTLDPAAVEKNITPRTKAVMPVHMCGSMSRLDELKNLCTKYNLLLLEDACQSTGGSYKGKSLGTIGDAGTLSFDFVKTVTCGEGGAILTNSKDIYIKSDGYSDHGHDHLGVDRGADLHPFIGYNFRISELHAAIGLAQLERLDRVLALQRKRHAQLQSALSNTGKVRFREVPDPAGDTGTFLSIFFENSAQTMAFVEACSARKIPAIIYWFNNNWHYIRKWDHLKKAKFLNAYPPDTISRLEEISNRAFPQSDEIMSRCISMPINLGWTDEQFDTRCEQIVEAINTLA